MGGLHKLDYVEIAICLKNGQIFGQIYFRNYGFWLEMSYSKKSMNSIYAKIRAVRCEPWE